MVGESTIEGKRAVEWWVNPPEQFPQDLSEYRVQTFLGLVD